MLLGIFPVNDRTKARSEVYSLKASLPTSGKSGLIGPFKKQSANQSSTLIVLARTCEQTLADHNDTDTFTTYKNPLS